MGVCTKGRLRGYDSHGLKSSDDLHALGHNDGIT